MQKSLPPTEIGSRLRSLRKKQGWSQSEMARQIGIQQSDISRIEKGEYRVSLDNLFRMLALLDTSIAEFFDDTATAPAVLNSALSHEDMRLLHLLRQLSPKGRSEVHEYIEFRLGRERTAARRSERDEHQRHA